MFAKRLQNGKFCDKLYTYMKTVLTSDQENAKNLIVEWFVNGKEQIFVLSGYAGTGKTFLIDYIVRECLHLEAGVEAAFVSPTGKAAANLVKKGTPAGTIHGLIYTRNEDDFDVNEDGEVIQERLSFKKRSAINKTIRLIIVDEASMINEEIFYDLLSFNVKCLFCGDGAQLPPVNGACPLLNSPNYVMKEIVRQAKDNPIIQLATLARQGEYIPYGNYGNKVCVIGKNALSGAERKRLFLAADQIICGRNYTRRQLNGEVRAYLGIEENQLLPTEGEKVICTLNDWEKPLDEDGRFFLVNGIVGRAQKVKEVLDGLACMDFQADFLPNSVPTVFDTGIFKGESYRYGHGARAITLSDGTIVSEDNIEILRKMRSVQEENIARFEFAYAITCHKAQGSEYDFVIVFDESWAFKEEKERWLYTAITRAKEKLLIIR